MLFSCLAVPTMNDNIDSASAKKRYIMFLMSLAVDPPLTCQNDKSPNVRLDLISLLSFLCAFCLSGCEGNTSVFHMEMYDGASKNRMIKLNIFLRRYEFCSAFLSSGNFSPSSSSPLSCGCALRPTADEEHFIKLLALPRTETRRRLACLAKDRKKMFIYLGDAKELTNVSTRTNNFLSLSTLSWLVMRRFGLLELNVRHLLLSLLRWRIPLVDV